MGENSQRYSWKRIMTLCVYVCELGLTDSKATFVPDVPAFKCSFSLHLVIKSQGETILCGWSRIDPNSTTGLGMWYGPSQREEPTPLVEWVCTRSKLGWTESNLDFFCRNFWERWPLFLWLLSYQAVLTATNSYNAYQVERVCLTDEEIKSLMRASELLDTTLPENRSAFAYSRFIAYR